MRLVVLLSARLGSFADAAFALTETGLPISAQHARTLAGQVGAELVEQRDRKADQNRGKLPVRVAHTPQVVAVEVDGGRIRTRAGGAGPGVHEAQNKEDKVACLVTLDSQVSTQDPQPEPPSSFLQPRRVQRLVQQMAGQAGETADTAEPPENQAREPPARRDPEQEPWAPRKRLRTCVASLAGSEAFGRMVAAEAKERDFYRAQRKAFVADGAAYNWKLQERRFAGFTPIVDFLHVVCYVYRAAWAVAADEAGRWRQYVEWLRACWQGRVGEVVGQLRDWQGRIGRPPPGEELAATDPRRAVAEALSYFGHNAGRMKYPEYRRAGLPTTSSLVESLVGEVNARVKGKQKYWNRGAGAEAILQLRAAVLSEDDRLDRYLADRPGSPYRRRQKQGQHTAPGKVATSQTR
ncbi:MAG TPA: LysR family transcriptional regulator [Gemmataceae bacterium]|nr:LysR family transcriptional regulator [Gemmataceae bacterium]